GRTHRSPPRRTRHRPASAGGAHRQLRALQRERQTRGRLRPDPAARGEDRLFRQARRRGVDGGWRGRGQALLRQPAGAAEGRGGRRPRPRRPRPPPRRLHRRGAGLHPACGGDERRLRPRRRGLRRCRAACPQHHRRAFLARRCRGRGRGDVRARL
ncbi:MAG: RidA/YER057c/UK114 superfamily, group 1, partial [uncultured Craurococcus sp.]